MKTRHRIFTYTFTSFCFLLTLISCNGQSNKNETKVNDSNLESTALKGLTNEEDCIYFIKESESNDMIKKFISDYKYRGNPASEVKGLSTETWIDKCVFISIDSFLQMNKKDFDGVRFYQLDTNPSSIGIVPTSPVPSPSPTRKHTDRPDKSIPDLCRNSSRLINIPEDEFYLRSDTFCFVFRKEKTFGSRRSAQIDSLSASIWLSSCVINKLTEKLKTDSLSLDGMMAFSAAYVKEDSGRFTRVGQKYINQSTLIFIPTKLVGTTHKPDYSIFNEEAKKIQFAQGGANHGQLCPQICD
jgi:hypothetical protein